MINRFIIGHIGSPHGLNGFVKVHSSSGEIDHFLEIDEIAIAKDGKERLLKIEEVKAAPPVILMRFSGIDSLEKAKTLNRAKLLAEREKAAPLNEGEFYIEDLKGLQVFSENDEILGHITDIVEGGGGDLIEILLSSGERRFIPFRHEFFPEINPSNGKVVLKNLWILE